MSEHTEQPPNARALNTTMVTRLVDEPAKPHLEGKYVLRVIETVGRRSHQPRLTPIGVLQLNGNLYLVSPDASRDWVRNLATSGACALLAGGQRDVYSARAVAAAEGASVVAAYLAVVEVPWALRAFPVGPTTPSAEIERHLDTIAVFRLDPGDKTGDVHE